jgi:hypothetical protein
MFTLSHFMALSQPLSPTLKNRLKIEVFAQEMHSGKNKKQPLGAVFVYIKNILLFF